MQVTPPKYVMNVINSLSDSGYSAYLVGGCVRDAILGVEPNDWDIATSALPEQILDIFPNSLTIGMKHGTITVKQGKDLVEVTTFRLDGDYADHRHPESVCFVTDLSADLSRRDFTINAIAMDRHFKIIDPFHGQDDLKSGLIRAVGKADKRFEEDALRMFRAFRFSSRLGFEIEPATLEAIYRNYFLASALSGERIRDELCKVLLTSHPDYIHTIISCGLLDHYLKCRLSDSGDLSVISKLDKDIYSRISMLCYLLFKNGCITDAKPFLQSLKFDSITIKCVSEALNILTSSYPVSTSDFKRLLSQNDELSVVSAVKCMDVIDSFGYLTLLNSVVASGECCHIKDLDINGNDLKALGFVGKNIGAVMNMLLSYVIDHPDKNQHDFLLEIAAAAKER